MSLQHGAGSCSRTFDRPSPQHSTLPLVFNADYSPSDTTSRGSLSQRRPSRFGTFYTGQWGGTASLSLSVQCKVTWYKKCLRNSTMTTWQCGNLLTFSWKQSKAASTAVDVVFFHLHVNVFLFLDANTHSSTHVHTGALWIHTTHTQADKLQQEHLTLTCLGFFSMNSLIEILFEEHIATFHRPVSAEKCNHNTERAALQDTELQHLYVHPAAAAFFCSLSRAAGFHAGSEI